MADLIQNVQEVYKKWESKAPIASFRGRGRGRQYNPNVHHAFDRNNYQVNSPSMHNWSRDRHNRQLTRNQHFKVPKFESLAQFKMAPCVVAESKARPFMGVCCSKCFPISKANIADKRVFLLSVCNILAIPHFQRLDFNFVLNILKGKHLSYPDASVQVLKSEKVYSTVERVIQEYNQSAECDIDKNAVAALTSEEYNKSRSFLSQLKTSVSSVYYQMSYFFVQFLLRKILNGLLVHKGQIEILRNLSQENIPIIYLPIYKTYLDYFLISFILYVSSLRVPLVLVDSDLYIPVLGYFTKFLGAIYVNRLIQNDRFKNRLQLAVTESYLAECLKAGHNLEFFIDANRRVADKSTLIIDGFLTFAMNAVEEESIDDVLISTVSISYEKMMDGNFMSEQLGHTRSKESTFAKMYSFWKKLHCNFGYIRLNFGQPFSMREFLKTSRRSIPGSIPGTDTPPSSPCSADESESPHRDTYKSFQESPLCTFFQHVIYDATMSTPLMSTQLVAFLFTTQYRKVATQQQLQNSLEWLRGELLNRKRDAGFTGESLSVIKRAVDLLGGHLVTCEVIDMEWTSSDMENNNVKVTVYKPVMKLPHVLELQYYAHPVMPLFLLDSMVVNSLYVLVDVEICHFRHCDSKLIVVRDKVIDKAVELSEILQFEFIAVPPCGDIIVSFNEVIDDLMVKECLQLAGMGMLPSSSMYAKRHHHLSFEASDDDDGEEGSSVMLKQQQLKIGLTEESINHLEFLRNVLSPHIESYWIAAISLLKLIDEVKEESVFIQEMQETAQDKLYKGLLAFEESFSAHRFKNSLKLFEHWSVVQYYMQDNIKIVYLNDSYNSVEKINDVIARIEQFRK